MLANFQSQIKHMALLLGYMAFVCQYGNGYNCKIVLLISCWWWSSYEKNVQIFWWQSVKVIYFCHLLQQNISSWPARKLQWRAWRQVKEVYIFCTTRLRLAESWNDFPFCTQEAFHEGIYIPCMLSVKTVFCWDKIMFH